MFEAETVHCEFITIQQNTQRILRFKLYCFKSPDTPEMVMNGHVPKILGLQEEVDTDTEGATKFGFVMEMTLGMLMSAALLRKAPVKEGSKINNRCKNNLRTWHCQNSTNRAVMFSPRVRRTKAGLHHASMPPTYTVGRTYYLIQG